MKEFLLSGVALLALAIGPALGADMRMPVKAPPPAPPPPPVQDWSGVYVGVEGGYGWGHQSFNSNVPFGLHGLNSNCTGNECADSGEFSEFLQTVNGTPDPGAIGISGQNSSGGVVGGFFGVQKQWGSWVLGLEGSIDYADITNSTGFVSSSTVSGRVLPPADTDEFVSKTNSVNEVSTKIDTLGAVNAKIGWAWSPNWLVYATGGLAFAHVKDSLAFDQSLFVLDCDSNCNPDTGAFASPLGGFARFQNAAFDGTAGTTMFGWEAGAGIDYKWQLDPGSAVVFGVDYKHYGFGRHTLSFAGPEGGTFSINASQDVDVVKGRISYLFSIH